MIALILAGGLGTRLRPHTEEIPKPLLPIHGKAILAHQIETLSELDVSPIYIVTGHLSEKIEIFVKDNYPDKEIFFCHNKDYADSKPAFGIISALEKLDGDVIYLNGDVLYEKEILKEVIDDNRGSTTAIQKVAWDEEEVNVILNEDQSIRQISKNIGENESDGEFIGVTKLSKDFIEVLKNVVSKEGPETFRYSFAIDLLNHVINSRDQKIYTCDITKYKAIEIDTVEDYKEAKERFHEKY